MGDYRKKLVLGRPNVLGSHLERSSIKRDTRTFWKVTCGVLKENKVVMWHHCLLDRWYSLRLTTKQQQILWSVYLIPRLTWSASQVSCVNLCQRLRWDAVVIATRHLIAGKRLKSLHVPSFHPSEIDSTGCFDAVIKISDKFQDVLEVQSVCLFWDKF